MSNYNFEDENDPFGATVRLDDINEKVKNYERENSDIPSTGPKPLGKASATEGLEKIVEGVKESIKDSTVQKQQPQQKKPSFPENKKTDQKGKRNRLLDYKLFIVFIVIIGIAIFIGIFFVTYLFIKPVPTPVLPNDNQVQQETPIQTVPEIPNELDETTALIKNINTSRELDIFDIENEETISLKIASDAKILDQNGQEIKISSVKMGDIVDLQIDKDRIVQVQYSTQIQKIENVSNIRLETQNHILNTGQTQIPYREQTLFHYKGKLMDTQKLDPIDVVTINTYQGVAYSVMVEQFHGYLVIKNKSNIKDGILEMDGQAGISLDTSDKFAIAEGPHKIVLKGSNIETYNANIYITANEEFEISLQTKTGVLVIDTNVEDYKLFINDTQILDPQQPQVLTMGSYTVRIEKEGYSTWEQTVMIDKPSTEIDAELIEEIKTGNLFISTVPENAYIYIDNVYIGVSPIETQVVYGDHRLLVEKEGYISVDSPIYVQKDYETISVPMEQNSQ